MPPRFTLPATMRLKQTAEFQRVYQRRRSLSNDWLIVYGCENDLKHPRLGLSVSRKFGAAVKRNRLRRLMREAFRLSQHELPRGIDLILIPRKTEMPTLEQLRDWLPNLAQQLARRLSKATP